MAVRAAGPGLGLRASQAREGRRRGPGPLPARPPSLPAARAPSGSRRRSAPAPPPPAPAPPARPDPRGPSREAGRQGAPRSRRAPRSSRPPSQPREADPGALGPQAGKPLLRRAAPARLQVNARLRSHRARGGALSPRPVPAGPAASSFSSPWRSGATRVDPRPTEAWGAGRTHRANNWKLLIVNVLRMAPAASWLSRAASQSVSGSRFCPGGKEDLVFLSSGDSRAGDTALPGLGTQLNRLWPHRAGKFSGHRLDLELDGQAQQAA